MWTLWSQEACGRCIRIGTLRLSPTVSMASFNTPMRMARGVCSTCECFLEYGEVTAEMAMMLAFVLFGIVLSGILDLVPIWQTLAFAALVIFIIRPSVLSLVLTRARISREARAFIAWFGPRGLNSLLLALLVVQANIPGAELLLATV